MDSVKVGKRMHDLRVQHNMTQQQLADWLSIGYDHCSKIENGKSASIDIYIAVAECFGVTLDYLLLGRAINEKDMAAVKAEFNRYRDAISELLRL